MPAEKTRHHSQRSIIMRRAQCDGWRDLPATRPPRQPQPSAPPPSAVFAFVVAAGTPRSVLCAARFARHTCCARLATGSCHAHDTCAAASFVDAAQAAQLACATRACVSAANGTRRHGCACQRQRAGALFPQCRSTCCSWSLFVSSHCVDGAAGAVRQRGPAGRLRLADAQTGGAPCPALMRHGSVLTT